MVNSLLRPYLNSCKGHITQETLNLIMFYHNHRRYKSGKRQGKAPIELLTGKPLEAPWWELLRQQINTARRYSPWHRAFKTTAATGGQQRWVYGSTGDCFRTNDRDPIELRRTIADTRILKRPNRSICAQSLIASLAQRAGLGRHPARSTCNQANCQLLRPVLKGAEISILSFASARTHPHQSRPD